MVLPPSAAVSAAELEADHWVLLRTPSARWVWGFRALALVFLALTAAVVVLGPVFDAAPRAGWRWALAVLGVLMAIGGAAWSWVCARLPRSIDAEVRRLSLGRGRRERRALDRALRRGDPIRGADRPAAAARAAGLQPQLLQPGFWLGLAGALLANSAGTATDVMAWVAPGLWSVMAVAWLGAAFYTRTIQRAAAAAGVAPHVDVQFRGS